MIRRAESESGPTAALAPAPRPLPPPARYGMPAKFGEWRRGQWEAATGLLDAPVRFPVNCAPTGFGKSLSYLAAAQFCEGRTVVLTSTKGLQTQLMRDFEEMGLVDVRGMNNYECLEMREELRSGVGRKLARCDDAPCHAGYRCLLQESGCLYYDAWRKARGSRLVVTNYAYWMTQARQAERGGGEGLGKVELLVLDEAHDAPGELAGFLSVRMEAHEVEAILGSQFLAEGAEISEWREWAAYHWEKVRERLAEIKAETGWKRERAEKLQFEARALRDVGKKLEALAQARGEWISERQGKGMCWDPVWPGEYAERYLFRQVPRVALVSATVRPKTLELLKIPPAEMEFQEWPSTFAAERRPVIHIPTVQRNYRNGEGEIKTWLGRIDQLIEQRLDRKGIIHTVSYKNRNLILGSSRFRELMVSHDTATTRAAVERFKRMPPPAVMVSPSLGTGWDFPGEECRYMIVAKVPFPDATSRVMKARQARDADYGPYLAAQGLVQMVGRGMRSEDDWCEVLVVDDNISWFIRKYRPFLPNWFLESYRQVRVNPPPLEVQG